MQTNADASGALKPSGTSNRLALNARVYVTTGSMRQMDEVRSGGSYLSQSDLRLHFGLDNSNKVDRLTIRWPSGVVDEMRDIPADQQIVVEEGSLMWRVVKERKGN